MSLPTKCTPAALRRALSVTQVEMAERVGTSQSALSQSERREMQPATLRSYIEALGGSVKIVAVFDDAEVEIVAPEVER